MKMIVFADLHTDCTDKIKSIDFSSYHAMYVLHSGISTVNICVALKIV